MDEVVRGRWSEAVRGRWSEVARGRWREHTGVHVQHSEMTLWISQQYDRAGIFAQ